MIAEQPKKRLSISRIEMLSKCGEQYRKIYVVHQKMPIGIQMIVGSAVDKAVTLNLDRKMIQGKFMSIEEIEELTIDSYRKSVQEARDGDAGIMLKEDELIAGEDIAIKEGEAKSVRLAKLHAEKVAPNLKPIYLQRPLFVELPGYPFDINGILDIQEIDSVRDTKTKGRTPAHTVADTDEQLTVYAMLVYLTDGAIPPKLVLDCLIDNKTPIYKPFDSTRVEDDFDVFLRRIEIACRSIESGVFLPARESDWWCGKFSCGFWNSCKYVKRSVRPTN